MSYTYLFTVFTPTYNRAHTLHRVYESLKAQTFRDFEWLIVDDGSTDGTEALVKQWQQEADFPIRYIWKENGGRHTAVNVGVQAARGELFLMLDSDDGCVPHALERFKFHWESIPADRKAEFSAVTALSQDQDGKLNGTPFPFDTTDSNSLEIVIKYNVTGTKWGFHRTDVLKQYPFPDTGDEKFISESYVWNRIALRYKTRYVNEILKIYHSSSENLRTQRVRLKYPNSARLFYQEYVALDYPFPFKWLLRGYANYVRYSLHARVGIGAQMRGIPSPLHWLLAFPVGVVKYVQDRIFMWRRNREAARPANTG